LFKKFGFSGESEFFKILGEGFGKGLFILLASIGTLLLTIGSAYAGSFEWDKQWADTSGNFNSLKLMLFNPISSLVSGSVLFLIGAFGTYFDQNRQNKRMETLDSENKTLSETKSALNATQEELQAGKSKILELHNELVTTWLKGLAKYLDLDSNSRVSVYYEHDEEFFLLARHSKNPKYAKIHRQKFPLNQGVISKAWEHETHTESNCPASDCWEDYKLYMQENYSYEPKKLDSLTMKSCRYYAKAIIDADIHIGVIVFESTEINFLESDITARINEYCGGHQGQLSKFVRDSLGFDKEVNIKREGKQISVESELIELIELMGEK